MQAHTLRLAFGMRGQSGGLAPWSARVCRVRGSTHAVRDGRGGSCVRARALRDCYLKKVGLERPEVDVLKVHAIVGGRSFEIPSQRQHSAIS